MTEEEAIKIAKMNGYGLEVTQAILDGYTPEEALDQYYLLPDIYDLTETEVPELLTDEEVDIMLDQEFLFNNTHEKVY